MNNMNTCSNCRYLGTRPDMMPCKACRYNNPSADSVFWQPKYITTNNITRREMDGVRVKNKADHIPAIKDVIFNPPATIIIWEDKTKTVVKCGEKDIYDPEKGMAMAISRKALGDRGSYYNVFEKWLEPYYKKRLDNFVADACLGKLGEMGCVTVDFGSDNVKIVNAETGEVSESDICEYDAKKSIKKMCSNCKRRDLGHNEPPCLYCKTRCDIYDRSYWEPKESDD